MLLGHDIVADREAEAGAFAGRLSREERLKKLIPDLGWYTDAVVSDADFNCIAKISGRNF
jgi:hypothetical protein